jgi:hypothetical protein
MTTTTAPALLLSAEVKRINKMRRTVWSPVPTGKVRVFVNLNHPFPEPTGPKCTGGDGAKCGQPAGECREVDHKVWTNEYMKPALAEQRALLAEALGREEFEALGKLTFSAKAGCSMCPCSPGFVAEVKGTQDLFVTLEVAPR